MLWRQVISSSISEEIAVPRSRKIVFFFPSFASSDATAPLGILAVATPLIRAGYQIVLIDSTITPDYKKRVLEETRDALCLGISLVTGPMIRETVRLPKPSRHGNRIFRLFSAGGPLRSSPPRHFKHPTSTMSSVGKAKSRSSNL